MQNKINIKSENMKSLYRYREYLIKNPKLMYLFIELTDKCNLACLHCGSSCEQVNGQYIDTALLIEALETVAQDFEAGSIMICITGGEPMLHKDFFVIVEKVVELGFSWGMTTNGTLIDADNVKKLKALKLQSVTISLDGMEDMHEWLRNVTGCFERTLRAVDLLNKEGILVQITSVIHKNNLNELSKMYELMKELSVHSWRIINLEPIGRALDDKSLLLSYKEMIQLLDFIRDKRYSKDTKMDVCFGCSHYLSYEYEHEVRDNYFICGSGLYVASILCNGDIYSCLDIERRPELVQGNISRDRFSTVWFERFKEFRQDRTQYCRQCSECKEKMYCNGDSTHTWDFDNNRPMFCIMNK
ncbi:MAG: radical SAM protein, partial [Lachnospira sp.]|nr:radical SAM protein [Lachnospira sp.]